MPRRPLVERAAKTLGRLLRQADDEVEVDAFKAEFARPVEHLLDEVGRLDAVDRLLHRRVHILWPSFIVAGLTDIVFTSLFDPLEIMYRGEALIEHRVAAYTIGFFVFWMLGIASSALTCYFQRGADEINRCPLKPAQRPEGCPKRRCGDSSD